MSYREKEKATLIELVYFLKRGLAHVFPQNISLGNDEQSGVVFSLSKFLFSIPFYILKTHLRRFDTCHQAEELDSSTLISRKTEEDTPPPAAATSDLNGRRKPYTSATNNALLNTRLLLLMLRQFGLSVSPLPVNFSNLRDTPVATLPINLPSIWYPSSASLVDDRDRLCLRLGI